MADRTLYTGGTFDLLHYGHLCFLKHCKHIADRVVVSLNTDEFVSRYKDGSSVLSYAERYRGLVACGHVDLVVPNVGGEDSRPAIISVNPDIIAIGDDWAQKDYYEQMGFTPSWLEDNEIVLVYIPYTKGISTSSIKARIIDLG